MKVWLIRWWPAAGQYAYYLQGPSERFVEIQDADVYLSEADALAACKDPESGRYELIEVEV